MSASRWDLLKDLGCPTDARVKAGVRASGLFGITLSDLWMFIDAELTALQQQNSLQKSTPCELDRTEELRSLQVCIDHPLLVLTAGFCCFFVSVAGPSTCFVAQLDLETSLDCLTQTAAEASGGSHCHQISQVQQSKLRQSHAQCGACPFL